jgi:hypothetical protein
MYPTPSRLEILSSLPDEWLTVTLTERTFLTCCFELGVLLFWGNASQ